MRKHCSPNPTPATRRSARTRRMRSTCSTRSIMQQAKKSGQSMASLMQMMGVGSRRQQAAGRQSERRRHRPGEHPHGRQPRRARRRPAPSRAGERQRGRARPGGVPRGDRKLPARNRTGRQEPNETENPALLLLLSLLSLWFSARAQNLFSQNEDVIPPALDRAYTKAMQYLVKTQQADGSWPNQHSARSRRSSVSAC